MLSHLAYVEPKVWVDQYDPTIEDTFHKLVTVDEEVFDVELVVSYPRPSCKAPNLTLLSQDTAGQELMKSLEEMYIKTGDGFLLVFSLTEADSINGLQAIRNQIVRLKDMDGIPEAAIPMVLIGNKCDLKAERQVDRAVGIALSTLWKSTPYCKLLFPYQLKSNAIRQTKPRQGSE
jgi:GTPase SAR1 family protein